MFSLPLTGLATRNYDRPENRKCLIYNEKIGSLHGDSGWGRVFSGGTRYRGVAGRVGALGGLGATGFRPLSGVPGGDHRAEQLLGREDDGRIVIDEVVGMLASLALLPARIDVAIVGFFLFRLFDIWKPPPARLAERLPGGLGVVMDDVVAGLYANLAGQPVWRVALPEGLW